MPHVRVRHGRYRRAMSDRRQTVRLGAPEPVATYRFQLTPAFGFRAVIEQLDHLVQIGVSHAYLSPIAEAVPGSTHGYDVVDHGTVRSEFGGEAGLTALLDAAADRGMGVVIDHVPNHVSVAQPHLNQPWWTLLRDGPESDAARWFDVDWDVTQGRVIVPQLGDRVQRVIGDGQIEMGVGDLGPEFRYGPLRYPLAAGTERLPLVEALANQHYTLAFWRDPARNVRRFFTIDELVAVRVEHTDVAAAVDALPRRLAEHLAFAGVRVDHVDGLADPHTYLAGLRNTIGHDRWLLVEKIVAADERLPDDWLVDGTTGYEHIRFTEHALVDSHAQAPLVTAWRAITTDARTFAEQSRDARREVLDAGLRPDLERLGRVAAAEAGDEDVSIDAFVELTLALDRYRTYLPEDSASDAVVDRVTAAAADTRPDLHDAIERAAGMVRTSQAVATRWQQLTSATMAKGAEDCAYYRYLPLAGLCEVGGAPGEFAISSAAFHQHQLQAQQFAPQAMLAGTTHDTKRSEHVRARALGLAERADGWAEFLTSWMMTHRDSIDQRHIARERVWHALETVVTATPLTAERLKDYLVKAGREAELRTSWTDPDDNYEDSLADLAAELLEEVAGDTILASFAASSISAGWRYGIAERAVRLSVPGVPDLYQGSLTPMVSLVDPDNRRPPDWAEEQARLERATSSDVFAAWGAAPDLGVAAVTAAMLAVRRRHPESFGASASYVPIDVQGPMSERTLAYGRGHSAADSPNVIVMVSPSDPARTAGDDDGGQTRIELPPGSWRSVLDTQLGSVDGSISHATWLPRLPVLVLERA